MISNSEVAFEYWKSTHKYNRRFKMESAEFIGADPVVLFFAAGDRFPWSVQYIGQGKYFETENEAKDFIRSLKRDKVASAIDVLWELQCYLFYLGAGGRKNIKEIACHAVMAQQAREAFLEPKEEKEGADA